MDDEELIIVIVLMQMILLSSVQIYDILKKCNGRSITVTKFFWHKWWRRPINQLFMKQGEFMNLFYELKQTDHEEFYEYTRMTPAQFDWLLERVSPLLKKKSMRRPFPPELRLALTLGYLGHADSVWQKKWSFRIGRSTVYKIIPETCAAIWTALQPIYLPAMHRNDWHQVAQGFLTQWNFPNCLGAVDGKHIRIQAPPRTESLYYNYKKFFSIVLMATCDAEYRFTWVDIGDYGGISDGGVWANSDFGRSLERGLVDLPLSQPWPGMAEPMPFTFVGDAAFPLTTFMMRPYAKPKRQRNQEQRQEEEIDERNENDYDRDVAGCLGLRELIFNYRLSRARRVIENSFGILVSKWTILKGSIAYKLETCEKIVLALVVLHNFLLSSEKELSVQQRRYNVQGLADQEGPHGELLENGAWRRDMLAANMFQRIGRMGANNAAADAVRLRNNLRDYFVSEAGEVEWQYEAATRNNPIMRGPL